MKNVLRRSRKRILFLLSLVSVFGAIIHQSSEASTDSRNAYLAVAQVSAQTLSTPGYFLSQNNEIIIEAEHYHANISRNGKSWVARTDRMDYVGDAAMVAGPDSNQKVITGYATTTPELQYRVHFDRAGTYHVWVRALADNDGNNMVHVGLDGQPAASAANIAMNRYREWKWRAANSSYTLNVSSTGVHTINVWMCKDGFRFDRLLLTMNRDIPSGQGPPESLLSGTPLSPTPSPISSTTPTPPLTRVPTENPTPIGTSGRHFYVSPDGAPSGNGSTQAPLDLSTALSSQKSPARPGDTVWLRGGVYRGSFISTLTGTAQAPINVRVVMGDRVTIDGEVLASPTFTIRGAYTNYRDLEITKSDPKRISLQSGSRPTDVSRGESNGIEVLGHHVKLINLIVHDDGVGIGFWTSAVDSEVYGCLIYNNGWDAPGRGHGHGIYAQNNTGTKTIRENVVFNQFGVGLQIYGSSNSYLNNFLIEGNVAFNNGVLSKTGSYSENILIGGGSIARNNRLFGNYTYFPPTKGANKLGYQKGCNKATVENNYFVGYSPLVIKNCTETTIKNNTIYGDRVYGGVGTLQTSYPVNTFYNLSMAPFLNEVLVRPNQYEPGRANIIVYNWQLLDTVYVDVSGVLEAGREYEVRNVQDFYGEPILSGIYPGGLLRLPMKNLRVARPTGVAAAPPATGPQFNVFVLIPRVN